MITTKKTIALAALLTAIVLPLGLVGNAYAGSGSSSSSNAQIDLYDIDTAPTGQELILADSFSGCWGGCAGSFTAVVFDNETIVTWTANSSYWHALWNVHDFSGGKVVHEGQTYNIPSSESSGSHHFSNTGYSPFSVDVEFYYN